MWLWLIVAPLLAAVQCDDRPHHFIVINLPQRPQRLQRFRERFLQLSLSGVELTVLAATDSAQATQLLSNATLQLAPTFVDPYAQRTMKAGEIGCFHSHYRAWQRVARLSSPDAWAVVVEDDAIFEPLFAERMDHWRSQPLDIAYYAHKKVDTDTEPRRIDEQLELFVYSYWTVGYALTARAARHLVRTDALQAVLPVDEYMPRAILGMCADGQRCLAGLRAASYTPQIIVPAHGSSDTELSPSVGHFQRLDGSADVVLLTVATDEQHVGYRQLLRSAVHYGYELHNAGRGTEWHGGDVSTGTGGGHKLTLVKQYLEQHRAQLDGVMVVFVDGYDTLLLHSVSEMAKLLRELVPARRVLFGAEKFCWPDKALASRYPRPPFKTAYRFLNSGTYAGRGSDLRRLLNGWRADDNADDQRFFTERLLRQQKSASAAVRLALDYEHRLFLPMAGIDAGEFSMQRRGSRFELRDGTRPAVLHGNGPAKTLLQQIANYDAGAWSSFYGSMWQPARWLEDDADTVVQRTSLLLLVQAFDTPFLDQFFARLDTLLLPPRNQTNVVLWRAPGAAGEANRWRQRHADDFASLTLSTAKHAQNALLKALYLADSFGSRHLLLIDSNALLSDADTLAELLRTGLDFVVPHAQKPGRQLYSNYWTSHTAGGWYAETFNTRSLYKRQHRGLWAVDFAMNAMLVAKPRFAALERAADHCAGGDGDADVCLARQLRRAGVGVYVDNRREYAELLEHSERQVADADRPHRDLYEAAANGAAWDRAYLDAEYAAGTAPADEVCTDVFGVRVFNERFCTELVAEMERYGRWSSGSSNDSRLQGGYEPVPTQDIHLNQIGFGDAWLGVLRRRLYPTMQRLYEGTSFKLRYNIAFIVRYITSGQNALRPHQDASAVTTVTTLSSEFEGGGARFTRYNCTHISHELGVTAFHPGRVTHQHEGLPISSGRRYILVSFNQ